jgi:TonB family protein
MRALLLVAVMGLTLNGRLLADEVPLLKPSMLVSGFPPRPEYPFDARRMHATGKGVFILKINAQSGKVESIQIKKSTGHPILDSAAINSFHAYRFKPGTPERVCMPITFAMAKSPNQTMQRTPSLTASTLNHD